MFRFLIWRAGQPTGRHNISQNCQEKQCFWSVNQNPGGFRPSTLVWKDGLMKENAWNRGHSLARPPREERSLCNGPQPGGRPLAGKKKERCGAEQGCCVSSEQHASYGKSHRSSNQTSIFVGLLLHKEELINAQCYNTLTVTGRISDHL